jgi:hypothetical protein
MKNSAKCKSPIFRWFRMDWYLDAFFGFWENRAREVRRRLRGLLHAAERAPRCVKRKSLQLSFEGLEPRMVFNTAVSAPITDPLQGDRVPVNATVAVGNVQVSPQDSSFLLSSFPK